MSGAASAPAPTSYNLAGALGADHRDFNRAKCSRMFQKPIAERPLSAKSELPAPNQYDVRTDFITIPNHRLISSAPIGSSGTETNYKIEQCRCTRCFSIAHQTIAGAEQTLRHTGAWCVDHVAPTDTE